MIINRLRSAESTNQQINHLMKFLLYGANGYTAQLIIQYAKDFGLEPILAGRSPDKIKPQADELGLEYKIFALNNADDIDSALVDIPVVLHAAGPFIRTARPMMEACIRTGTHYLDITGEIEVFELGASFDEKAKEAKVMILPGTGFDVVPTDCLALYLKKLLPNAKDLQLAFATVGGSISHGTATTMVENLGKKGAVRRDGTIKSVPIGHDGKKVPFADKSRFVMAIPWGDVSTAYYSTNIPNITTYTAVPPKTFKYLKYQSLYNWILRTSLVQNYLKKRLDQRPAGPNEEKREQSVSQIWGQVTSESGEKKMATLTTPNGYTLTALTSLLIAQKVLNGEAPVGFQTPAKAYGEDLVLEIVGVSRKKIES